MSKELNFRVIIGSCIFFVVSMTIMIGYHINKELPESSGQVIMEEQNEADADVEKAHMAEIISDGVKSEYLCIPLRQDITEQDVAIVNDAVNNTIQISIEGLEEGYFYQNKMFGNIECVKDILYHKKESVSILEIELDALYECRTIYEEETLYLQFVSPREIYEKIIVINPGHGGEENGNLADGIAEKDINLDIALKLKDLLDKTDIKVYYTRLEDVSVDQEKQVNLANEAKADMFINIHCGADTADPSKYGIITYYNENFFIPSFSSVDLAYIIEESITEHTSSRALGIEPADEKYYVIRNATVPVAHLEVGFLTNKQELTLLKKDDYRERIAKGMFRAIESAYKEISK